MGQKTMRFQENVISDVKHIAEIGEKDQLHQIQSWPSIVIVKNK